MNTVQFREDQPVLCNSELERAEVAKSWGGALRLAGFPRFDFLDCVPSYRLSSSATLGHTFCGPGVTSALYAVSNFYLWPHSCLSHEKGHGLFPCFSGSVPSLPLDPCGPPS